MLSLAVILPTLLLVSQSAAVPVVEVSPAGKHTIIERGTCRIAPACNDEGLKLITKYTNFYDRPKQIGRDWTCGYEHKCKNSRCSDMSKKWPISKHKGQDWLKDDLKYSQQCLASYITTECKLNENQYAALLSWTHDQGCDTVRRSRLIKELNQSKPSRNGRDPKDSHDRDGKGRDNDHDDHGHEDDDSKKSEPNRGKGQEDSHRDKSSNDSKDFGKGPQDSSKGSEQQSDSRGNNAHDSDGEKHNDNNGRHGNSNTKRGDDDDKKKIDALCAKYLPTYTSKKKYSRERRNAEVKLCESRSSKIVLPCK
ncbi:Putative Lysozyme-like domain superfamily protein [Septoria linicola]|uniref:Lysozyme-like domain superfamily protein n=1 Tax=Septoria linicola TaxID=215465 RepID=A0A9Q9AMS4_9PEZI|nr:putative Lysozyme-like domain superfamily protein [Septoria linicola]USW47636.1 Putative Lysozyme-like domain superfamily protein [Septoria linicola]